MHELAFAKAYLRMLDMDQEIMAMYTDKELIKIANDMLEWETKHFPAFY